MPVVGISSDQHLFMIIKMALLKFTRKEGEGYRSELQDYKDDVKNNGRIKDEPLEMNHPVSTGDSASGVSGNALESKPYDEWEAIQRELALYPDARDRDDMVSLILFVSFCFSSCWLIVNDFL